MWGLCSLLWVYCELCSVCILLWGRGSLGGHCHPCVTCCYCMHFAVSQSGTDWCHVTGKLCGLLLQVHSWLDCLLHEFLFNVCPQCLYTQHIMEEVTQERAKVPRSPEVGKLKRPVPWSLYLEAALQEQIQGCKAISSTFSMTVPAVEHLLMWVPPGPWVDLCWDRMVKVVPQCSGEGKTYIRE